LDVVCAEVREHNPTASNDERLLGNDNRTLAESERRPGNEPDLLDQTVRGERNVDDLSDLHAVSAKDRQSYYLRSVRLRARCNGRTQEESGTEYMTDVTASSHRAQHGITSRNQPVLSLNARGGGYKTVGTRGTFRSTPLRPSIDHRASV
jgi:hypothetical protein